ncbi:hypothetical protein Huta_0237 [Halorhabdus utahensis DSM 12940]|uniref:Uncharacterized protein n=1 Tax=Halorhabdus utahensis (strain DSM 12940 / JCM 11049 / AX-2) TaxID=519442 RepID=C7NPX8_HALUD|nr:hypothetical protein Huta_0237 [Halorhabdus utahensis DSM 12940]
MITVTCMGQMGMFRTATVRQKVIPVGSQADLARRGIRTLKGIQGTRMQPRRMGTLMRWNTVCA